MKTHWKKIVGLLIVIIAVAVAQSAYYYTMTARRAIVSDSLRVQGTTKLVGAVTIIGAQTNSGLTTNDSLKVNGQSYFGAVVDYLSKVSEKNALFLYAHSWFNSRSTPIFRLDSVGTPVVPTVVADTGAFSTTLATAAIYIPGALSTDVYFVTKRNAQGVSTSTPTDSTIISYMAKPDSLIVKRQFAYANGGTPLPSGEKFSYLRLRMD